MNWTRSSQGDFSISSFGIGPRARYYFGSNENVIPFAGLGGDIMIIGTNDSDNQTGFGFNFGGGVIIRKGHVGFSFEGNYQWQSFNDDFFDERITGNNIFLSVGIVGFLY